MPAHAAQQPRPPLPPGTSPPQVDSLNAEEEFLIRYRREHGEPCDLETAASRQREYGVLDSVLWSMNERED